MAPARKISTLILCACLLVLTSCGGGNQANPFGAQPKLTGIRIYSSELTYTIGNSDRLYAYGIYDEKIEKDISDKVNWVSSDEKIARITRNGELTTHEPGEVVIRVYFEKMEQELPLLIKPLPEITAVFPSVGISKITQGDTIRVDALGNLGEGRFRRIEEGLEWSTSNENIAVINEGGILEATGYGDVTIYVKFGQLTGEVAINILPELVDFEITPPGKVVVTGKRIKLISDGVFSDGNHGEVNRRLKWSSVDANTATVEGTTGIVTAKRPGTVTIRALFKNIEREIGVSIIAGINVKQVDSDGIALFWEDMDASGYNLFWSKQPGVTDQSARISLNKIVSYQHQQLTPGTTYYYRLQAIYDSPLPLGDELAVYFPENTRLFNLAFEHGLKDAATFRYKNTIYVHGGQTPDGKTSIEMATYNFDNNRFDGTRSANSYRHGHSVCVSGDYAYVLGGISSYISKIQTNIDILNLKQEQLEPPNSSAVIDTPRAYGGCVTSSDGKYIFYFGGEDIDGNPLDSVSVFLVSPGQIELVGGQGPSLSIARSRFALTQTGNKIIIAGGRTPDGITDNIAVYDLSNNSWTSGSEVSPLSKPMEHAQIIYADNNLYRINGYDVEQKLLNNFEVMENFSLSGVSENSSWVNVAQMIDQREHYHSYLLNGHLFILGGLIGDIPVKQSANFSFKENLWYPRKNPAAIHLLSTNAQVGESVYLIGGITADTREITNAVQSYSIPADQWRTHVSLPFVRYASASAVLGTDIYVIGGVTRKDTVLTDVDIFETTSNSWRKGPSLPYTLYGASATALDGKIYVVGGDRQTIVDTQTETIDDSDIPTSSDATHTHNILVLDPETDSWQKGAEVLQNRRYAALLAQDDSLYYIGGQINSENSQDFVRSVHRYDILLDSWETLRPLNTGGYLMGATVYNRRLHVFGGLWGGPDGQQLDQIQIYDPLSGIWTHGGALSNPTRQLSVGQTNGILTLLGGLSLTNEIRPAEIIK
ncbi:MAG: Ig-like domain-containing protein [Gammaproteobacteria bacterium]|nr:Ig-like domain-containing protein [Gammaproteobacteria bacterium]